LFFFKNRSTKSKKVLKSLENYSDMGSDTYSKNQKEEDENRKNIEEMKKSMKNQGPEEGKKKKN
jgi:hypothetical protein